MRDPRWLILFASVLTLVAARGWPAEAAAAGAPTICIFPLANLSPGGSAREHDKPLSDAVRQEFDAAGFHILPDDAWQPEAARLKLRPDRITEAPEILLLGQKAGVDMAVSGFYRMEKGRVLVSVQCYDVKAGTLITGFLHTWRFNLGFYNSIHQEIADLVQRVVFLSAPKLITLKDEVRVDQITFTSPQEGMEVVVEGQRNIGRITNGALVFRTDGIKAGTPLWVEKKQPGYHTLWQKVMAAPRAVLTPLPRANNLSVELDWTAGQLTGAGGTLRWYPVPDWIMVNFSEYLYVQVPFVPSGSWPLHADSELLAGLYLFLPPQSSFRMGISAGLGTILTWIPSTNLPLYTDFYVNVLSLWGQWQAWGLPMLARIELKVPLGVGNHLLQVGPPLHWGGFLPPITLGVVIPWL